MINCCFSSYFEDNSEKPDNIINKYMNLKLRTNDLEILRKVFNIIDLDQDGQISRNDLKNSSGFENDKKVESIFQSLKPFASDRKNDQFISFKEFCKGIMDLPSTLEYFKREYFEENRNLAENFSNFCLKNNPDMRDEFNLVLIKAINFYRNSIKLDFPNFNTSNQDSLLSALRYTLKEILDFYSQEHKVFQIVKGSMKLYSLIRDLFLYHEKTVSCLNKTIQDCYEKINELKKRNEILEKSNERLVNQYIKLENKGKIMKKACSLALKEKKELQERLETVESQEINYIEHIQQTEKSISFKEKEIEVYRKQLNRLKSLKTIQEIKELHSKNIENQPFRCRIKHRNSDTILYSKNPGLSSLHDYLLPPPLKKRELTIAHSNKISIYSSEGCKGNKTRKSSEEANLYSYHHRSINSMSSTFNLSLNEEIGMIKDHPKSDVFNHDFYLNNFTEISAKQIKNDQAADASCLKCSLF